MDAFDSAPAPSAPVDRDTALPFDEMQVRQLDNGLTGALRTLIRHPDDGLAALPAEQALSAVPETMAAIDRIGETWFERAGTPQQKKLALPLIDARIERARTEIAAIAQRAIGEIDDSSVEERLAGLQQDAAVAWRDRHWLRVLGRTAVNERSHQGERNGWDAGRTEVNVRRGLSDVYAGAVEAAMAEDIDGADGLLAHSRDVILPERRQALERQLADTHMDRLVTGIDGALAALPLDPMAPPSPESYRMQAEELMPDDASPDLRARIASLADGAHRRAARQWQAERNRAGLAAIDWMIANPGLPVAMMDRKVTSALAPRQILRLQEIETNGRLDTHPEVFAALDRLAVYDPKGFATLDLAQYRLGLDGEDYARFTDMQKGSAAFQRYEPGRRILDAGLVKAQLDPDGNEARAARAQLDRRLGAFETIEGRPPAMADIERIARGIVPKEASPATDGNGVDLAQAQGESSSARGPYYDLATRGSGYSDHRGRPMILNEKRPGYWEPIPLDSSGFPIFDDPRYPANPAGRLADPTNKQEMRDKGVPKYYRGPETLPEILLEGLKDIFRAVPLPRRRPPEIRGPSFSPTLRG